MEKMKMTSLDMKEQNINKISIMFPNCITETIDENGKLKKAINFKMLRQMLFDDIVEGDENYEFTWVGKKAAIVEANKPIKKTLRPYPNESINWDTTENLYIEGDNLEVLKLLQESYLNKIKMIYIDPPYNTGNDFIYNDEFQMTSEKYSDEIGEKDKNGNRMFKNADSNGRFHSDWCSMIYSRLMLARNLLNDEGVIFISIDDNEIANLIKICDEIFGQDNFQGIFVINASPSAIDYGCIAKMHEYAVMYSKNSLQVKCYQLKEENKKFDYKDELGEFIIYPLYNGNVAFNPQTRPNLFYPFYLNPNHKLDNDFYEIGLEPKEGWVEVWPVISQKDGIQRVWRWGKEEKARKNLNKEIVGYKNREGEYRIVQKYRSDKKTIRSLLLDKSFSSRRGTAEVQELFGRKVFSFPKPIELLKQFTESGLAADDIVMDFFSGSASMAQAIMELNAKDGGKRKYILVQWPEACEKNSEAYKAGYSNICEIGKARICRAGKAIREKNPLITQKLDVGFRVFKSDTTNMQNIYYTAGDYSQGMLEMLQSNIKEDRTDLDLLFGCLLEWGLPLSLPYTSEQIDGCIVHNYNDGDLIACFDENIPDSVIKAIAKKQPLRAVFRDSSFTDSPSKINVDEIFKLTAPNTRVKVI
ncbi:site-specific DNA-methyltransferase [Blautia wexlerae]|uniref:site-specific DNA-methyltransferase n=1 Tax=Blautia wexlerae TaxID=418240 RepID=UPI0018AB2894|nr:site-specific DNA-methyltransferase [Blautia wexlerae]MDB6468906.1 site-specific DNA-methyltransferase [Blautia wexlerae]